MAVVAPRGEQASVQVPDCLVVLTSEYNRLSSLLAATGETRSLSCFIHSPLLETGILLSRVSIRKDFWGRFSQPICFLCPQKQCQKSSRKLTFPSFLFVSEVFFVI